MKSKIANCSPRPKTSSRDAQRWLVRGTFSQMQKNASGFRQSTHRPPGLEFVLERTLNYWGPLHLHLGYLSDAFIQNDLQ